MVQIYLKNHFWHSYVRKQPYIPTSLVRFPLQIILIFTISSSIYIKISHNSGISAGNSNQTRFRFQSGVRDFMCERHNVLFTLSDNLEYSYQR